MSPARGPESWVPNPSINGWGWAFDIVDGSAYYSRPPADREVVPVCRFVLRIFIFAIFIFIRVKNL